jgi:hypothetical protein
MSPCCDRNTFATRVSVTRKTSAWGETWNRRPCITTFEPAKPISRQCMDSIRARADIRPLLSVPEGRESQTMIQIHSTLELLAYWYSGAQLFIKNCLASNAQNPVRQKRNVDQ